MLNLAKLGHFGIAPKLLDLIELAGLRVENMDHRIEVVDQYPAGIFGTFRMNGHSVSSLLHFLVNAVRDGLYVGTGIAFANDEKISRCFTQFPQVQLNNIFAFLVADTFDNAVVECLEVLWDGLCPSGCGANQVFIRALSVEKMEYLSI